MLNLYLFAQFFKMLDLYIRDICLFFGSHNTDVTFALPHSSKILTDYDHSAGILSMTNYSEPLDCFIQRLDSGRPRH